MKIKRKINKIKKLSRRLIALLSTFVLSMSMFVLPASAETAPLREIGFVNNEPPSGISVSMRDVVEGASEYYDTYGLHFDKTPIDKMLNNSDTVFVSDYKYQVFYNIDYNFFDSYGKYRYFYYIFVYKPTADYVYMTNDSSTNHWYIQEQSSNDILFMMRCYFHEDDFNPTRFELFEGSPKEFGIRSIDVLRNDVDIYDYEQMHYNNKNVLIFGKGTCLDEDKVSRPFDVTVSPELNDNMTNVVKIPGKQGINGDYVDSTSNLLTVKVTMTDDFKTQCNNAGIEANLEYIIYVTTKPPEDFGYTESANSAVYTYLHYGKYMYNAYTNPPPDLYNNANNNTNAEWVVAEGVNAGCFVNWDKGYNLTTIDLANIDFANHTETPLYLVVYGRLAEGDYPCPDYFCTTYKSHTIGDDKLNSEVFAVVDDNEVAVTDYYCWTSDIFNYKSYPDYISYNYGGTNYDNNGAVDNVLLHKIPPNKMADFDLNKNGESFTPDDFNQYESNKKLANTYESFDFGIDSISGIFDSTSDLFGFLTSSISIFPTWFLTILTSFFVIMLAIVVIKFVL